MASLHQSLQNLTISSRQTATATGQNTGSHNFNSMISSSQQKFSKNKQPSSVSKKKLSPTKVVTPHLRHTNNFMNKTNLAKLHENLVLSKKLTSSVKCLNFSKTRVTSQRSNGKSSENRSTD